MRKVPGQLRIALAIDRHLGGKFASAGVELDFDSLRPYSFDTRAVWPSPDDYTAAIREEVERVMKTRMGDLKQTQVTLVSIKWNAVDSCESAFRLVARLATEAAFE